MAGHKTNTALPSLGRQRIRPRTMTHCLESFKDIHSHDRSRALDGDTIVNIEPGEKMLPKGTYSIGIHPWKSNETGLNELRNLVIGAHDPRVVAIGECGFDKLRGADMDRQQRLFEFHARLAEKTGKPLIIHAVGANDRLVETIRRMRPSVEWIIHGFRGKPQLALQLLRAGYSLSLGKIYNRDTERVIPASRLYRETD